MKIGIDFHNVIDVMPELFAFLTDSIIKNGGEVHIITGGLRDSDKQLIEKYDIKYTKIFSIVDYHKSIGTKTNGVHPKHGFPLIEDDDLWNHTKGKYCKENGIHLHIDDTENYKKFFETPFCLINLK
jgi:hypothetical protein